MGDAQKICKCNGFITEDGKYGGCSVVNFTKYDYGGGTIESGNFCFIGDTPSKAGDGTDIIDSCENIASIDRINVFYDQNTKFLLVNKTANQEVDGTKHNLSTCSKFVSTCKCNGKSENLSTLDNTQAGGDCAPQLYKDKQGQYTMGFNKWCNVGSTNTGSGNDAADLIANKKEVANKCLGIGSNGFTGSGIKNYREAGTKYVKVAMTDDRERIMVNDSCGMKTWVLMLIILGSILGVSLLALIVYLMM